MVKGDGQRSRRRSSFWSEQLPLVLGGLLVVAGVVLVTAVVLGSPPESTTPTAISSPADSGSAPAITLQPSASAQILTPAPTEPGSTPQPTPRVVAETALDLTWRSLDGLPGTADDPATQTVAVAGLARGPRGYVAVGEIVDGFLTETGATGPIHPAIWTSADGVAWQLADGRALGDVVPVGVAATGDEIIVLASSSRDPVLLRSSGDGAWSPVTPPDAVIGRIAAAGPGFVAVGLRLSTNHQAIWSSVDGATWDRTWESDVDAGESLTTIGAGPGGSVVVGGTQLGLTAGAHAAALVSPDGLAWTRVDPAALPRTMGFDAIGLGADGAWYGAGFDGARGGIGVWRSADGTSWTQTTFGPAQATEQPGDTGSASAVFAFDGRTFVLAYTSCCGYPPQRELVTLDGRTWARADRSSAVRSTQLSAVLVEPDRVLAVGGLNRAAGVWLATGAPSGGVEFAAELAPPSESDVCGTSPELRLTVEVDRKGVVARIRLVRADGSGAELTGVIWPYGWHATAGPPLTIRNAANVVVLREGDELTLTDGRATGGSYHVCTLNGEAVWGQ